MKKLLMTLSFLGTGTIVGVVTLPAIVSCAPITHKQMLEQQLEKDYVGIFNGIKNKYDNMSDKNIQSTFMNFVFPENKKMNMTHGYDVMQWNTIETYTYENDGFKKSLIPMVKLKNNLNRMDKIESKRNFLMYDEVLRIMATDFNKYANIFSAFSENKLLNASISGDTEWTENTSVTLNLKGYYAHFIMSLANKSATIPPEQTISYSKSLPLNPDFEKALALVISFKNSTIAINSSENDELTTNYRSGGMIEWLNSYWKASYELGFLPDSYESNNNYTDEIVRTSQMESYRTKLFSQSVLPIKSEYFHIEHSIDIDQYLDEPSNMDNHDARWMNPKDLIDYYSSVINPITIYGISNSLLRMVKEKEQIIDEPGVSMNLKFSKYLIDNIYEDHFKLVLNENDQNRKSQFGGVTKYMNVNNSTEGKNGNRFLSSNQVDLSVNYQFVEKV